METRAAGGGDAPKPLGFGIRAVLICSVELKKNNNNPLIALSNVIFK